MTGEVRSLHPAPSRYYDPRLGSDVVKIKPGEYFATTRACVIATVLGSCVAACIRDPLRGSAGMNHFLLPDHGAFGAEPDSSRYGVFAMEALINEFIRHGSKRSDLVAKVFGGGAVSEQLHADIGGLNAAFVLDYLRTEGIAVAAADLRGTLPRKVLFFTATGVVRVGYLSSLKNDTIERRELEYARGLATARLAASVELF